MKKILKQTFSMVGALLFVCVGNTASAEMRWIGGANESCYIVCNRQGYRPAESGTYKNGSPFYICGANVNGEGVRAGYNLAPNWDNACWVAYGGQEFGANPYICQCYR